MAQDSATAENRLDALIRFLHALRTGGYTVDTRHYVALSDLLIAIAARGEALDWRRLKTLLAPIVCSTAAEQEDFYARYDQWLVEIQGNLPRAAVPDTRSNPTKASRIDQSLSLVILGTAMLSIAVLFAAQLIAAWMHVRVYVEVALAIVAAGVVIWRCIAIYRENQYITRQAGSQQPLQRRIPIRLGLPELLPVAIRKTIARDLRRRTHAESPDVDVEAVIDAAVRRLGWIDIAYKRRQVLPEYVVLNDRRSKADQHARFVHAIVEALSADGVLVREYEFRSDPRICFPVEGRDTPIRLSELQRLFPNARALVFSALDEFFSPLTGYAEGWVEALSGWSYCAIVTPSKITRDTRDQMQALDISVAPMTLQGLTALGSSFSSERLPFVANVGPPLPDPLAERPVRWIGRDAPDASETHGLLRALRDYLGDSGFYWLCATAIYPELHWEITLFLGSELKDTRGYPLLAPDVLLRLTTLPWYRAGYMPDWWRRALVDELTTDQDREVRALLGELLTSPSVDSDFVVEVSQKLHKSLSAQLRSLLRVRLLHASDESPEGDRILIDFLLKRDDRKISVALPLRLRRFLVDIRFLSPPVERTKRAPPTSDSTAQFDPSKRLLEFGVALIALFYLPLFAIAILIDSGFPIFVTSQAVGKNGRTFTASRFRTVRGADESSRPNTPVGRFLRESGFRHLPLFLSVLRGEISAVGSLLLEPEELAGYANQGIDPLAVPPGITGPVQLAGGRAMPITERARLDREYMQRGPSGQDLRILMRTWRLATLRKFRLEEQTDNSTTAQKRTRGASGNPEVLIVEDDPTWTKILKIWLAGEFTTTFTASAREALESVRTRGHPFDVALIDLRLFTREAPSYENVFSALRELFARTVDTPTVILTKFLAPEAARMAATEHNVIDTFDKASLHPDELRAALRKAAGRTGLGEGEPAEQRAAHRSGNDADEEARQYRADSPTLDVVILTAHREQYAALLRMIPAVNRLRGNREGPNYYAWEVGRIPSRSMLGSYRVAIGLTAGGGSLNAAAAITDAFERWAPRYAFLVGLGGGLAKTQRGDVVLAEAIHDYGHTKVPLTPDSGVIYPIPRGLRIKAQEYGRSLTWRTKIHATSPEPCRNEFITGMVVSANRAPEVRPVEFLASLAALWPRAMAVTTEGAGIARAIERVHVPRKKPECLMLLGISNTPGSWPEIEGKPASQHAKHWELYAAEVAAAFTVGLISSGLPMPPRRR